MRVEHTKAVGIVHHQPGIVSFTGIGVGRQRRFITIHAEDAIGHHQFATGIATLQLTAQGIGIIVGKAPEAGPAEQAAVQ